MSMAATDSRLVRPTCVGLMRYAWSVTTRRYKSIGVYQAKTHLPQLIDEISDGQTTVVITRYGTPVAVLEAPAGGPKGQDPVSRARRAAVAWDAFGSDIRLGSDTSITALIEAGRD